jgi:protein phosphatase
MIFSYSSLTDPGLARENNEDAVAFDAQQNIAILADGMGGYNAGEVASGMTTAFVKSELSRWREQTGGRANLREIGRAMEICVENANRSVFNAATSNPQYSGMGTTLVLGVFHEDALLLGHIGDSRCYRLRGGVLEQITRDHSLLQEQIDAGLITAEEAVHSANKNLVTRALGVEDSVVLELHEHAVLVDDLYLMCSDGLSDMASDETIASILNAGGGLDDLAKRLVAAALEGGGRDNVSVLLVRAAASPPPKSNWFSKVLGR